jgi:cytochrome c553
MNATKQPRAGACTKISVRGGLVLTFLLILFATFAGASQDGAARHFKKQCAGCHGEDGSGSGSTPALRGLAAEEAQAALLGYRERTREGSRKAIMERVVKNLSDEEIKALADHVAGL